MKVLKFGGSSVANANNISKVSNILKALVPTEESLIVVVSALGGVTDTIISASEQAQSGKDHWRSILEDLKTRHVEAVQTLLPVQHQSSVMSDVLQRLNDLEDLLTGIMLVKECSARTKDNLISYGELLSSWIIGKYLSSAGLNSAWKDSRELIVTDSTFGRATVNFELTNERVKSYFNGHQGVVVLPGFIASDKQGNTTTLGRGGSDYTASIIAAAIDAEELQIWTDVSGMMSADPRVVANAKAIDTISYREAMELSHFGAKVIYPPTIQPVMEKKIPLWVKNTFQPDHPGTGIFENADDREETIKGISSIDNLSLVSLEGSGMVGIPGFSKRLFDVLATHHINVIFITQASSEHSISVGVESRVAQIAKEAIDAEFKYEIHSGNVEPLVVEPDLSLVAVVGDGMKNHVGISGRMFSALGRNGINIRAIAQGSSERNITAVISKKDARKAINVLHEEFFETTYKQINLFIAGTGNVGQKLISQIHQQQQYVRDHLQLQLRISGIANSRQMAFADDGIDPAEWKTALGSGEKYNINNFVETIISKNLRNSVFVDVTANADVAGIYETLFNNTVSVVACNKIACSSSYETYKRIKHVARDYSASFFYETNVGAGLPVIGTLNDLLSSGDTVTTIKAVLSGTLNYVFNNYDGSRKFADIVRQAQEEGYTEPDPRLDLGGFDVMRKIMILAREAGNQLEIEDVANNLFMPPSCMEGSVEDFYREMEKHEAHFRSLFEAAKNNGTKLKFVASYSNSKASVGLEQIGPEHDFYHLYGKDNIVLFFTKRYVEQPLVVKGAGAGAEVTASGVFADIIRASRIHLG